MTDEQQAVQTQEPTTEPSTPDGAQNGGVEEVQQPETKDNETSEEHGREEIEQPEAKPSRQARRIHDLVEKLKAKEEPKNEVQNQAFSQQAFGAQDPFSAFDDDTREVLRQAVVTEADKIVQLRLAQNSQATAYIKSVDTHISDLEQTAEQIAKDFQNNPKVAAEINDLIIEMDDQANYDESGRLIPRVKASQLYNRLKKTLERERINSQSEVTASMAKRIAEESPKPGNAADQKPAIEELRANLWKNPAAVRKEIESRLAS